ncbi:alginate export family protein [Lujinxingia litoralis]|uniref:alginate export family protein n=1 Tax=Lujinxingia litoralis TaxID=2211119 RepID=UPI0013145556|nr:alginate export family protein [Lujinxingia litoralis]
MIWASALSALALMMGAGEGAAQESPPESTYGVYVDGEVRPRLEFRLHSNLGGEPDDLAITRRGDYDRISQRSRLGVTFEQEMWAARVALIAVSIWGRSGLTVSDEVGLSLYEGWAEMRPMEALSLKVGRFPISYGEGRVLSGSSWNQLPRTWDAVRMKLFPHATLRIDTFAGQYRDGGDSQVSGQPLAGDDYLIGTYGWYQVDQGLVRRADVYALHDWRQGGGAEGEVTERLSTVGARVVLSAGPVELEAEGAGQFGRACPVDVATESQCAGDRRDVRGYFYDTELSVDLPILSDFDVVVGHAFASGDDPGTAVDGNYRQLFGSTHSFHGKMDFVRRTNLREYRLGFDVSLGPVSLVERAHLLERVEGNAGIIGVEVDSLVAWGLYKGLTLDAGYGVFFPGEAATESGAPRGERPAHWVFMQLRGTFGSRP